MSALLPKGDIRRPYSLPSGVGQGIAALPIDSNINLLSYRESVVDLDTKISDCALDLCVTQQYLHCPKVASTPVNQRSFGSSERMGPKKLRVRPGFCNPFRDQPSVLLG